MKQQKIGELVRLVDNKNKNLQCTNLKGLSMTKEFREPTSNIVGTDLSKYKIVSYKQFACDFMSAIRVHRMPIALNFSDEKIIVSPAYAVFEVVDEDIILPEYLMLWFSRPEFDRYADFKSDSAIRGGYDWEELCNTTIRVPDIDHQRNIVEQYKTIERRIALKRKINDNLESQAYTEYKAMIKTSKLSSGRIIDLAADIICGKTPSTKDSSNFKGDIPFITIPDMHNNVYAVRTERYLSRNAATGLVPSDSICVSCIATAGLVAITDRPSQTNQQINTIVCKQTVSPYYVFFQMKDLSDYIKQIGLGGSTTCNLSKTGFSNIEIQIPDIMSQEKFSKRVHSIFEAIKLNQKELNSLESALLIVLTRLSN